MSRYQKNSFLIFYFFIFDLPSSSSELERMEGRGERVKGFGMEEVLVFFNFSQTFEFHELYEVLLGFVL
jgi:hypothetical protein